jgi:hypothetical protein
MLEYVKVMDNSSHVEVSILVRELNSGISYITSFGIVVVSPTRQHTRDAVDGEHVNNEG